MAADSKLGLAPPLAPPLTFAMPASSASVGPHASAGATSVASDGSGVEQVQPSATTRKLDRSSTMENEWKAETSSPAADRFFCGRGRACLADSRS